MSDREPIELVANFEEAIVLFLETFVDLALAAFKSAAIWQETGRARDLPLENNFSPSPAPLH